MDYIILVAGTPGTGKTLVSRILAGELGCRWESSSRLLIESGLAQGDPTGRHTLLAPGEAVARASVLLPRGCLVLETVYPSLWMESPAAERIAFIALLRTHPLALCERLRSRRGWPREKVLENCAAEALNVVAEEAMPYSHETVEVDTTGRSPEESAEAVLEKAEEWDTGIRIDWLAVDEGLVEHLARWLSQVDLDKYRLGY